MDSKFIVDRIYELSGNKGIKKKYLCEILKVRPAYFTDCRSKGLKIADDILVKAAHILDTTVEYLKGETDNPLPHSDQIKAYLPYEKRGMRPVIGLASAGLGVIAEEMILDWEYVDDEYDNDNCFWIKVAGDSMSPKIDDGDLVLIQRDVDIGDGNIVVAVVDRQDGFIKQVHFEEDTITLHSFNPYYPDMVFRANEVAKVRFVGKAREVKRIL